MQLLPYREPRCLHTKLDLMNSRDVTFSLESRFLTPNLLSATICMHSLMYMRRRGDIINIMIIHQQVVSCRKLYE